MLGYVHIHHGVCQLVCYVTLILRTGHADFVTRSRRDLKPVNMEMAVQHIERLYHLTQASPYVTYMSVLHRPHRMKQWPPDICPTKHASGMEGNRYIEAGVCVRRWECKQKLRSVWFIKNSDVIRGGHLR